MSLQEIVWRLCLSQDSRGNHDEKNKIMQKLFQIQAELNGMHVSYLPSARVAVERLQQSHHTCEELTMKMSPTAEYSAQH